MNWPCRLLVAACSCGVAVAQQVPDINDVYTVDRSTDSLRLGPAMKPTEILDRYAEQLRDCSRFDYTVSVTYPHAPEGKTVGIEGAVAISRTRGGGFNRFQIDVTGTMPSVGAIDVMLGSTGRGFYVIDRLKRTVTEFKDRDNSIPFGSLARHVLISDLPVGGVAVTEGRSVADGSEIVVHVVDETFGEHIYGVFSEQDWLPRQIEWVALGSGARASLVRTRITDLRIDDAESREDFEISVPDGYRKLKGPKRPPE